MAETAIIIPVHVAEAATRAFRERWDSENVRNLVPPHITVLYPFRDSEVLGDAADQLAALFAATTPFDLCLAGVCGFPDGTLFLAPDDARQLDELTARITAAFPETPPYGGRFADLFPHLTLGVVPADEDGGACAALDSAAHSGLLPVCARVDQAALLVRNADGSYRTARSWPFAPKR